MKTQNISQKECRSRDNGAYYSGHKAARVKFSVAFFFYFFFIYLFIYLSIYYNLFIIIYFNLVFREITHKTSGHELSSRSHSLYSSREAPS